MMAIGNWRQPSIRDLTQFVNASPPPDPNYAAWRQAVMAQGPERYATPIVNRGPNIPAQVRQNLGVDPRPLSQPVRGIDPNSTRYEAFRRGLGVRRPSMIPQGGPSITMQGRNVAPRLMPAAQAQAWDTAAAAQNASRLNQLFPGPPVQPPAGGPSIPMGGQNIAPQVGNFARPAPPTAPYLGPPSPPQSLRQGLGQLGGGFKGAGALNAGLGTVALGMPGALQSRYGVDFNNPVGRPLKGFLQGAGLGTMAGGPLLGATTGVANANREVAAGRMGEQRRLVGEATGNNKAADAWIKSFQLGEAAVNPIGAAGGIMDAALDKAQNLPVIGGFFGGGDEETAPQEQQPQQPQAPAKQYNRGTLEGLMSRVGVAPQYQEQLLEEYNVNLELAKEFNEPVPISALIKQSDYDKLDAATKKTEERTPVSDENYQAIEDAGGSYLAPDEEIEASVWEETANMIPQLLQQQQSQDDYLARQASLQAVIAPFIGQYFGQGQETAGLANQYLGAATANLPAGMQGAAQNLNSTIANGYGSAGDALAGSLAMMPGLLAMEGMDSDPRGNVFGAAPSGGGNDFENVMQNQYNQALAAYQLKQQYPELFAKEEDTSDPMALFQ